MEEKDVKIRVNALEKEMITAIEKVAKEYPDLTTAETGRATLRILKSLNDEEIRDYIKTSK